jgi:predicted RNase H-like HicB family nuclease
VDTITVIYHREPDGWWAEAPAVTGWSAAAATLDELREMAETGVRFALGRDDVQFEHRLPDSPTYAPLVFDFAAGVTLKGDPDTPGLAPRRPAVAV